MLTIVFLSLAWNFLFLVNVVFMLDPNLNKNEKNYRYNHKYINATKITRHFINIRILKYAYKQNGNKLAFTMVAYI